MLRPGFVQRAWRLLQLLRSYGDDSEELPRQFGSIEGVPLGALLDLLARCGYVESVTDVRITGRGIEASERAVGEQFSHHLLRDYLNNAAPNWAGVARQGRSAFLNYVNAEVLQCFEEAGLLRNDLTSARWWDEVYVERYASEHLERLQLGRRGEGKSVEYETKRIGVSPDWVSLHQPTSPFDLLSFTSEEKVERLLIEVKASTLGVDDAHLYISTHEWTTLSSSRKAVLHLWADVDSEATEPFIVAPAALEAHLPTNTGEGGWEIAKIPFAALRQDAQS